jgi:uncharacterized coiled-coil protein SlyX
MADCNSLETLLTTTANELASLKTRLANLESKGSQYATKSELSSAINGLKSLLDSAINGLNQLIRSLLGRDNNELESRVRNLEIKVSGLESIFDSLNRAISAIQGRLNSLENKVNDLIGRLSGIENSIGSILMDIRNIYNILNRLNKGTDLTLVWAAIAALQAQIALILRLLANLPKGLKGDTGARGLKGDTGARGLKGDTGARGLKGDTGARGLKGDTGANGANGKDGINGINGANGANGKDGINGINGRNGANGKDGINGINGRNGANGKDGKDGKNGVNGTNGKNGTNGTNGTNGINGKDLKMEYSTISGKFFASCDNKNKPVFNYRNVVVIKGTEIQALKSFEELANIRAQSCSDCDIESDGEEFGEFTINTIDRKFTIPSNAQKIIIQFTNVKPYVSKRFSSTNPKYKNGLGTISFLIGTAQSPDQYLHYQSMVLDVPKSYKNVARYAYLYLEDCNAIVKFWKKK